MTESTGVLPVPPQATFTLVLSQLYAGPAPVLPDAQCVFSYNWDFGTNMGLAKLESIDGVAVNIELHPLGIAGWLDFMSDMKPTTYNINGVDVVLFRVILDISLATGERSGAIMFNTDGSVIQTTSNFGSETATKLMS